MGEMPRWRWNSYEMKIIEAALRVVDKYTISGTRTALIAQEAQMSTTNLHYHFKTKHELMLALLQYTQEQFARLRLEDLDSRPQDLRSQLGGFFAQKKDILLNHRDMDRVQFDFWSSGQVNAEIAPYFEESFALWRRHIVEVIALYEPGLDRAKLEIVSQIMVSMMMGATLQGFGPQDEGQIDRYFNICLRMVAQYLEVADEETCNL